MPRRCSPRSLGNGMSKDITPLRRGHHMSGTQNHREDWRVEPGIGKPSCSAVQAHGTQTLNAASGHSHAGLAGLLASCRRATACSSISWEMPCGETQICGLRPLRELVTTSTPSPKCMMCTTTSFAPLHRRFLDTAMSSAACVLWPAKTVLWSTTSTGRGCDRYPCVDRTWFIANFSPADIESFDFDLPFLS